MLELESRSGFGFAVKAALEHVRTAKGWNSNVSREFPRKFESTNLSRDNLSREIGRTEGSKERRGAETLVALIGWHYREVAWGSLSLTTTCRHRAFRSSFLSMRSCRWLPTPFEQDALRPWNICLIHSIHLWLIYTQNQQYNKPASG